MSKMTVEEAKAKYNLTGKGYDTARTWFGLSRLSLPEELLRQVAVIQEIANNMDWTFVSRRSRLSEEFIREFQNCVNWYYVSGCQRLSEEFIREFKNKVNWHQISIYQKLSEAFIHEFRYSVDWRYISAYQKLSEPFIREHQDYVNWLNVSIYQPLSENFIQEFADKVRWYSITCSQAVSKEFLKKFGRKFGRKLRNNSDKPVSYWKEKVQKTGLYECHKDFFYAYKGIRSDRYSRFNFQYRYLPGKTYECFSDYSDKQNSFGLSAWTVADAEKYCSELIIKVKIYYRNVTAVVHGGGKIRCKRMTVME